MGIMEIGCAPGVVAAFFVFPRLSASLVRSERTPPPLAQLAVAAGRTRFATRTYLRIGKVRGRFATRPLAARGPNTCITQLLRGR